jgi:hypothetical protein
MNRARHQGPLRRTVIFGLVALPLIPSRRASAADPVIEVWAGPSCSCCHDWLKHLEANAFGVKSHDGGNSEARARLGTRGSPGMDGPAYGGIRDLTTSCS